VAGIGWAAFEVRDGAGRQTQLSLICCASTISALEAYWDVPGDANTAQAAVETSPGHALIGQPAGPGDDPAPDSPKTWAR